MSGRFYYFPWLYKVEVVDVEGWRLTMYVNAMDRGHARWRAKMIWNQHFGHHRTFDSVSIDPNHTPEQVASL